jgi:predicted ATPase
MITELQLKSGPTVDAPPLTITTTPVTVFVGPNNSGKSRVLREIDRFCTFGTMQGPSVVLAGIKFSSFKDDSSAEEAINRWRVEPRPDDILNANHILLGSRKARIQVHHPSLLTYLKNPLQNLEVFCSAFLQHSVLMLDGPGRVALVNQQPAGDLQQRQHNPLGVLFTDDLKRTEVRRIVHDAFGLYFVVDPTLLGQFRIRLSSRLPTSSTEERGIDDVSMKFHAEAQLIDHASDGVKAFVGIIIEVIAGDPGILLIDEPEAFLHPALAFKLGQELARAASGSEKRVFIATHSPAFVMGCIQSGTPVNIIRLTYKKERATARLLPSGEILKLMRNPLLRSTNVVEGLFFESVVVTEADADRAFYQEVNDRLLRYKSEWGIPNCLFLHAQNKQTIATVLRPLRKLGIPAAGILDIDILKAGGADWRNLMESAGLPDIEKQSLATLRTGVKLAMEGTGQNMKTHGGLALLTGSDREAADGLLSRLAAYGLFVIAGGELESWLKNLGATGHGPNWLIKLFEMMGEDPESSDYLKPSDGDVWKFVACVREWMVDPMRKGIPAA